MLTRIDGIHKFMNQESSLGLDGIHKFMNQQVHYAAIHKLMNLKAH